MQTRPLIIPLFIPHAGCPRRCVFCNQGAVIGGPPETLPAVDVRRQVETWHGFHSRRRRGRIQIAFFGGNFLGLGREPRTRLLAEAGRLVAAGRADGIRFSTRPDTVSPAALESLRPFPVQTVELGVQSMSDRVLDRSERGHSAEDTRRAAALIQGAGYELGLQLMIGLPGDDEATLMETGREAADLSPDFVRIYPTLVLEGSRLADWHRSGDYRALDLDEAVRLAMRLLRLFHARSIPVIRLGLQPTEELSSGAALVAGPYHPAFGARVQSECFYTAVAGALRTKPAGDGREGLAVAVNHRSIGRMRGLRNANSRRLKAEFGLNTFDVVPDPSLPEDAVRLPDGRRVSVFRG